MNDQQQGIGLGGWIVLALSTVVSFFLMILISPMLVLFGLFALADRGGNAVGGETYKTARDKAGELLYNLFRLAMLAGFVFLFIHGCVNRRTDTRVECDYDVHGEHCTRY